MSGRPCELILHENGGVELLDGAGRQRWHSEADEDFADEFPDFVQEEDTVRVLDYLVDTERLTDEEADACEITELSFAGEDDEAAEDDEAEDE